MRRPLLTFGILGLPLFSHSFAQTPSPSWPNKTINVAVPVTPRSAGDVPHLNGELFRLAAGFDAVHLPFKGAPEAMTEVIAGRSAFYFSPLVNALPLMKDGQLQALAVSNSSRASALPDIPTIAEAGYPNSEYNFWAGVFVPVKTPAPIKEKLYAEIAKALA